MGGNHAGGVDIAALDAIRESASYLPTLFPGLSTRYVPGEGGNAEALLIGEAPGATEDQKLRPFVGAAGQVLRELMGFAGLHAGHVNQAHANHKINAWLTNVVKFRPDRNRAPTDSEIKAFRGFLIAEWQAVGAPDLIIPIGKSALQAVVGKPLSILRYAGKPHKYTAANGHKLTIWPMVHPAFGLRVPGAQDLIEHDWEVLGEWRKSH